MKWYPWLRSSYEQIIASHQAGCAHHALLIHSLPGMGEQSLIYAISRWLMCQQPDGQKSCGHCRSCQLMQAVTHPDHYRLEPETGKSILGVDAIRQLSGKLYEHARMGGNKLIWLLQAEQLTESAANALLKTLEEPPQNSWFLLSCYQPQRIPATLRSRCICWHLAPPDPDYALAWLSRENPAPAGELQMALRLTGGAPLAALQLLQPQYAQPRQLLCQQLAETSHRGDWYRLLAALDNDQVIQHLHWLASLMLDAMKYQQGAANWLVNLDQQPLIQQLAARLSQALLNWLIPALFHCREQLLSVAGLNRELMLAELLLEWEMKQKPAVIPVLSKAQVKG